MEGEEAVKIFDIVVKNGSLPQTLDKLVPLSFIGAAAVKFYQAKVKLMDQLGMKEDQRKATLSDGQDAGEMLLTIEASIGELVDGIEKKIVRTTPHGSTSALPEEIAGDRNQKKRRNATAIHRNPSAVAAIIKEARENEDIPTKTAVLHKIKADKEEKARKEYERQLKIRKADNSVTAKGEAAIYLSKMREVVLILPAKVPKDGWSEGSFAEAKAMAEIIHKRLEDWDE